MPWLLGTALLHSAIVVEKRDALKVWTILLAILTFSLSLIGTFIVRSGLLTSVHAFATDPERGIYILALLGIAIGGSLTLFAIRAPALGAGGLFAPVSREGGLVLNNLLLATATATVFIGTLYPLFMEAVGGGKVSVGPPFYNRTFVPIMTPLLLIMAVGPLLPWKRADLIGVLSRLKVALGAAIAVALLTIYLRSEGPVLAIPAMALVAWLFVGTLSEWAERVKLFRAPLRQSVQRAAHLPRAHYGMTFAHAGLAVAIAGMIGSAAWKSEEVTSLAVGESTEVANYTYTLEDVAQVRGPNYESTMASFRVTHDGREIAVLRPEKRFYPVQGTPTTEAAIHSTGLADLYAVIGDPSGEGWTVRIYHEPLVPWIWAGALVMVAGGLLSLSDRRLRVGAPSRRVRATSPREATA
jgi:cytochrome c-type biogenesis protein CcmF